ncbi:hypothetical protein L596_023023 [Steinernema carpocapsae]|uniref:G-protein coupled receptors family 1 profile domain-containing protein n=1 Tax=Steinernema carpocapsae TaxID=34508 RepID=A0A4U5MD83_STECR|nr:hypothetical protein L596_023023 [Steinernema carpocapsae]
MIVVSVFYVYLLMVIGSTFTLALNGKILFRYFFINGEYQNHLQYYCVLFYSIFAFSTFLHGGYKVYALRDENPSRDSIFWTGVFVFCSEYAVGVGNIFIAFDRFLAVQSPMEYRISYNKVVLRMYVLLLPILAIATFLICILNREITAPGILFGQVVNLNVVYTLSISNSFACFLGVPISVIFLISLYKFNKRQIVMTSDVNHQRMRRTNQIVIYQLLLEVILVIIPMAISTIINFGFGINLPAIVGSYPLLVIVIYTSACSILFTVKLTKAETRTSRVADIRQMASTNS